MNAYLLTLMGSDLYAEDVLAPSDADAIRLTELGIDCDLQRSSWTEAVLTNESGDEVWRRHQLPCSNTAKGFDFETSVRSGMRA